MRTELEPELFAEIQEPAIWIDALAPTVNLGNRLKLLAFANRAHFLVTVVVADGAHSPDPEACRLPTIRVLDTDGEVRLDLTAIVAMEPKLVDEDYYLPLSPEHSGVFCERSYQGAYELLGWQDPERETSGVIELTYDGQVECMGFVIEKAIDVSLCWGLERGYTVDLSLDVDFQLGLPSPRALLFDMGPRSVVGPMKHMVLPPCRGLTHHVFSWTYETWPPVRPRFCLDLTAADGSIFAGTYFPSVDEESYW